MTTLLLLVICGGIPNSAPVQHADIVEVNHVCDRQDGRETLVQVIWWEWSSVYGQFVVIDWRILSKCDFPHRHGTAWIQQWRDGPGSETTVVSKVFRETWTLYDVEIENRSIVPEQHRRRKIKQK